MMAPFQGITGKPVEVRCEPVAVFGDEPRNQPLACPWQVGKMREEE